MKPGTHKESVEFAIGIEIGGTKIQVGIGSMDGSLLAGGVIRKDVRRELGAEGIRRDIGSMLDEMLDSRNLTLADIGKIGIGFGGLVDAARGVTLKSYQVEGWTDFPLKEWAEAQWGRPVFVENDAGAAALGESLHGNGRGYARVFYVTVGSGVGGGWVVNGKLDHGQGLGSAEIGHTWVPDPQTGAWIELEQVCSGWGIGARARVAARGADSLMERIAGSLDGIDAKVVYSAAEQGDAIAKRILQETCETLGAGLSNVAALLHPERVILGGGVSLMGPLFWDALQREFRRRVMPIFAPQVELARAKLGEDVVVIGALCLG